MDKTFAIYMRYNRSARRPLIGTAISREVAELFVKALKADDEAQGVMGSIAGYDIVEQEA